MSRQPNSQSWLGPSTGPSLRTPTSGVIIEVLYLCTVALGGGLSAWAIQRAARPQGAGKPPPEPKNESGRSITHRTTEGSP